jgi:erythrocyte band 7 integral membrane protein
MTSSIKTVSLRTRTIDMPHQTVYTKDNMSVFIDTTLFFRVIDPYKVTYHVQDIMSSLFQLTIVTLRTICG